MVSLKTKLTYDDLNSLIEEIKQTLSISSVYDATQPDESKYIKDKISELEKYLGDDMSYMFSPKEIAEISEIVTDVTSKLIDDTLQLKKERENKNEQ